MRSQYFRFLYSKTHFQFLNSSNARPSSSKASCVEHFVNDLSLRGLMASSYPSDIVTDAKVRAELSRVPPSVYAGFDPTADSLHVGNLLVLVNLLRSAHHNCRPIALVGGATAAIGDPSGRDTERDESDLSSVQQNASKLRDVILRIASNFDGEIHVVNNHEWYKNMNVIEYLRLCRPFRVGSMMRMGAIRNRMEEYDGGISFTEFSYQTLQSHDWLHLSRHYDCYFQLGGSDQLGHLDQGAHYIKKVDGRFAGGICLPLITDASGNKLGKSTGAGIWLSAERTSPYQFFQFWRQLHDTEAEAMLPKFSLRSLTEVQNVLEEHRSNLGKWIAQESLAREMTELVHGKEGLETAVKCSRVLFQGSWDELHSLDRSTIIDLFGSVTVVPKSINTFGALADRTRMDQQKGSQLMRKGAFKVNGNKCTTPEESIDLSSVVLSKTEDLTLICWGKRNYQLIQWE